MQNIFSAIIGSALGVIFAFVQLRLLKRILPHPNAAPPSKLLLLKFALWLAGILVCALISPIAALCFALCAAAIYLFVALRLYFGKR